MRERVGSKPIELWLHRQDRSELELDTRN